MNKKTPEKKDKDKAVKAKKTPGDYASATLDDIRFKIPRTKWVKFFAGIPNELRETLRRGQRAGLRSGFDLFLIYFLAAKITASKPARSTTARWLSEASGMSEDLLRKFTKREDEDPDAESDDNSKKDNRSSAGDLHPSIEDYMYRATEEYLSHSPNEDRLNFRDASGDIYLGSLLDGLRRLGFLANRAAEIAKLEERQKGFTPIKVLVCRLGEVANQNFNEAQWGDISKVVETFLRVALDSIPKKLIIRDRSIEEDLSIEKDKIAAYLRDSKEVLKNFPLERLDQSLPNS